jgi:hypothetical protein
VANVLLLLWLLLSARLMHAQPPAYSTTSPHGKLKIACQNCHNEAGWKPIRPVPEFNHDQTRYPLRGMHEGVDCTSCHSKMVFTNVGSKCEDCHADIHRRQFGSACESCHTVKGWTVSVQQIQQHQNRFPLIGAHAAVDCASCHKGAATGQFQGLSTQCYSCHATDYQQTTGPNHAAAGFSSSCEQCHGMDNWFGVSFNHLKYTGYALTGAHATLQCNQCHVGNRFKGTPADCAGCHLKDYDKATNPNHVTLGLPQTCQSCHSTAAWQPATFDHNLVGFPLTGAHTALACSQCHANNNFNLTVKTCVSCHLKDFQKATNPNHTQFAFPQTCETCHNTAAWQPATFNHATSGFPLTGAHATLQCSQCHISNNYNITNTRCVSCHLKDYQNTTDPNHVTANFPQTCEQCHNTTNWGGASFNHASTGWALTGAHTTLQCSQCHINGNYNLNSLNTVCYSCHSKDYQNTTDPNHAAAGFPTTCEQCHNTSSWGGGSFNHATTGWALTGAHLTLQCSQCHLNGNYSLNSSNTVCYSCHSKDYQNTTDPNHVTSGFPTTCEQCHNTASWGGGSFNHATTGWALTGAHLTLQCSQCHVNNNYNLNSSNTVCSSCHMKDYTGTTDPAHASAGFPTTCDTCHSTTNWLGASFNHSNTAFPLTGAHVSLDCNKCHVNNNYTSLPTNCYGCHQTDYTTTTNPNHAAAAFPTTCNTCHTTSTWLGAVFNHTWFPIYSGTHNQGVWTTCADCHTNANDYSVYSCINCHTHSQSNTNGQHDGVSGYVYNGTSCYQCHPTGQGGG